VSRLEKQNVGVKVQRTWDKVPHSRNSRGQTDKQTERQATTTTTAATTIFKGKT
jgi:hypothetical protein